MSAATAEATDAGSAPAEAGGHASPTDRLAARLTTVLLGVRLTDRLAGWLAPALVALVGGILRFWRLGDPHQLVFDETYYVKQAYSLIRSGIELRTVPTPDALFTHGTPNVFTAGNPDFVVHPPVGKWMIAVGEQLFGINSSFGWRFSSAVVGTLSILMLARIARRMFRSTLIGVLAAVLLAFEGHHFVQSRTGLLDIFVMFFALAGFACILLDRDQARARLARRAAAMGGSRRLDRGWAPGLGVRPWRLAAGVCLGLCTCTKWSGLYFLAAFAVMSVLWDVGARRAVGQKHWLQTGLLRDGASGFVTIVPIAVATYLAGWTGWFRSTDGWDRTWALVHGSSTWGWVPASLRSLWHYHAEMWNFHVNLHTPHPYQANPWSWIVMGRPTSFFYEASKAGQPGCTATTCSKAINPVGTPVIWWGATAAVLVLLFCWLLQRDWRAGAILGALAAGYLPWFAFQERTIFSFYAVAFVPYVVLTLTYALALVLGPPGASVRRRQLGGAAVGVVVVAAVASFMYFYPIYTAEVIPYTEWSRRMWLPSWI